MTFSFRRATVFATFLLVSALGSTSATAANEPVLVHDFAPGASPFGLAPTNFATAGDRIYFAGNDPDAGYEPWESDGSAAGTHQVADLCPGRCSSSPRDFTQLGEAVVFNSFDEGSVSEVYAYAGGEVRLLLQLDEQIFAWAKLASEIYFLTQGNRLYRTDGTAAGTRLVQELCPAEVVCAAPAALTEVGGALYFAAYKSVYRLLPGGVPAVLVSLPGSPAAVSAREFTPLSSGGLIFLACASPWPSCRLYVSDGTVAGSHELVAPIGLAWSSASYLVPFNGRIYFHAYYSSPYRVRIASTDGTTPGTRLETAISGDSPGLLGADSQHLYFVGTTQSGSGLSTLAPNGTIATLLEGQSYYTKVAQLGHQLLFNYGRGGGSLPPTPAEQHVAVTSPNGNSFVHLAEGQAASGGAVLGQQVFFSLYQTTFSLWRSDGSAAGTEQLDLPETAPASGYPRSHPWGADLIAEAFVDDQSASRIWQIEGASNTVSLLDPRPLQVLASSPNAVFLEDTGEVSEPALVIFRHDAPASQEAPVDGPYFKGTLSDDNHYFFTESSPGQELWESDGSAAGTSLLFEMPDRPCAICFESPSQITPTGNFVYYVISSSQIGGAELWVWDRVLRVQRLLATAELNIYLTELPDGRVVFSRSSNIASHDWWLTDGSSAGTRIFASSPPGFEVSQWAVAGSQLFASLRSLTDASSSLWVSDFTSAGTREILAPSPGYIAKLVPSGNHLFFVFRSGSGNQLGYSDGTAAGTRILQDRPAPRSIFPVTFLTEDSRLVYAGAGDAAGDELWISDGTASGTVRLTDLNPGPAPSSPNQFAQIGSRLYFQASDGVHGRELWALELPAGLPACPSNLFCLQDGRFEVTVTAHAPDGDFVGQRALADSESGVFTFFSANNWEMQVKVLDGCQHNQAFWVFAAAASDTPYTLKVKDRSSGAERVYESTSLPAGPLLDTAAFSTCGLPAPAPRYAPGGPLASPAHRCADDPNTLCLGPGGRFRVAAEWQTTSASGVAAPVPSGSTDSGLFTFFSPSNWELMVKVLDGCALNNKFWVFAAGTTDQGFTLKVTDRTGGGQQIYRNPLGQPARSIADTQAFPCD